MTLAAPASSRLAEAFRRPLRRLAGLALALGMGLALGLPAAPAAPASAPAAPQGGLAFIDVLDVGQGDSILIRSPEGKTALVDAGLDRRVVDRIRERGVESIDLVVVSHHHTDHYGGMDDVIRTFHPRMFLATGSPHTTSMYLKLLKLVKAEGMTAVEPSDQPRRILLGSVEIVVLPQPPENAKSENDNSIGLRVQYGGFSILLTGDSEERSRAWWLRRCPELVADCDVLKLAHHGSRNGTNAAWLDVVRPALAVVSLSEGNTYGHPHAETLSLLSRYQLPLLRTDQRGTITIRTDGRRWRVDPAAADRYTLARVDGQVGTASASRTAPAGRRSRSQSRGASTSARGRSTWRGAGQPGAAAAVADEPSDIDADADADAEDAAPINLNTATYAQLQTLPGIGPMTARRIMAGRPYRRLDDLRRVPGFDDARLAEIRSSAVVR